VDGAIITIWRHTKYRNKDYIDTEFGWGPMVVCNKKYGFADQFSLKKTKGLRRPPFDRNADGKRSKKVGSEKKGMR